MISIYKKSALALSLVFSGALFSAETNLPTENAADSPLWFFNVRTNVNSASIIAGTWAVWSLLYNTGLKAYENPELSWQEILTPAFKEALPYAGFALALWCVDKGWLRTEYYYKVASMKKPE